jgi:hypothetical protein
VDFTVSRKTFGKLDVYHRIGGDESEDPEVLDRDPFVQVAMPERFWMAMAETLKLLR